MCMALAGPCQYHVLIVRRRLQFPRMGISLGAQHPIEDPSWFPFRDPAFIPTTPGRSFLEQQDQSRDGFSFGVSVDPFVPNPASHQLDRRGMRHGMTPPLFSWRLLF